MSDSEAESETDEALVASDSLEDGSIDDFAEFAGGSLVRYAGADWITGVPARADLLGPAREPVLQTAERGLPLHFLPVDVEDVNEFLGGYPTYVLRIFGVLPDGSKAEVVITDVPVFFDAQVPDGETPAAFEARVRRILSEAEQPVSGVSFETVQAYPDRGYRTTPATFKRIRAPNLQIRRKALEAVHEAGVETKSDDRSAYYRKAAREHGLPLSDWAVLSDYEYAEGPTEKSPLCQAIIRVSVANYRPLVDPLASPAARAKSAAVRAADPLLARERILVMAWDIETHSGRGAGDLPMAQFDADQAFMVCLTAHWKDEVEPLCRVCLVDVETAPDRRWTTVVCGSPLNVLRAFALCFRELAPDVIIGFNDSGYDWPFVVGKAERARLLGWMVQTMSAAPRRAADDEGARQWNYRDQQKIKVSAEETLLCSFLRVPGCVPIDVRACFKKLYPKSETPVAGSLKFYLEVSGLSGKADMPIRRMWRHYEAARAAAASGDRAAIAAAAADMRAVAHYCIIDSQRCQELMVRRAVLGDYREVSTLAFVSLADSHYYAGGMKVCNLLAAYAWRRNILMAMAPRERAADSAGKYPGAYVFPPAKGIAPDPGRVAEFERAVTGSADVVAAAAALAPDRPVTGLDFSSLYPSLIMAYNLIQTVRGAKSVSAAAPLVAAE